MIRVRTFDPADAAAIVAQDAQRRDWPDALAPHVIAMAHRGSAFTLRLDESGKAGRLLCIAGLVRVHAQAATAWTVMGAGCWGHMGDITRIVKDYLDGQACRRIDMIVRADFAAGHRWAARLGFEREAVLRAWAPDGGDMVMHARIRGDAHG